MYSNYHLSGAANEEQPRIASLEDEVKKVKQQLVAVHSDLMPNLKQQVN